MTVAESILLALWVIAGMVLPAALGLFMLVALISATRWRPDDLPRDWNPHNDDTTPSSPASTEGAIEMTSTDRIAAVAFLLSVTSCQPPPESDATRPAGALFATPAPSSPPPPPLAPPAPPAPPVLPTPAVAKRGARAELPEPVKSGPVELKRLYCAAIAKSASFNELRPACADATFEVVADFLTHHCNYSECCIDACKIWHEQLDAADQRGPLVKGLLTVRCGDDPCTTYLQHPGMMVTH